MVSVDIFRQFYTYLANKSNVGNTMTTPQYNINCFQAMMIPYAKDYETFVSTGVVSQYLQGFLKGGTESYVFNSLSVNQIIPYPSDFQYVSSVGTYYNQTQNDATLVDNVAWREMFRPNSLNAPTTRFPKYQQIGSGIVIAPANITGYMDYFYTPPQPVWNYTIVNNRQVFNPTGSVNLDIDAWATNMVMAHFLQFVGINLQDNAIAGFAQAFTAETNLPL